MSLDLLFILAVFDSFSVQALLSQLIA